MGLWANVKPVVTLITIVCVFFIALPGAFAQYQNDSSRFEIHGDFRFRMEQDWDSRKADGSMRDDKSRLRFRARFGAQYNYKESIEVGIRIRTGDPRDQQDPHITLGTNTGEFSIIPLGFEKIYASFRFGNFSTWVGKNTYPFLKIDEMFWNDNVFPEGVALNGSWRFGPGFFNGLGLHAGHFIARHAQASFSDDASYQAFQAVGHFANGRVKFAPAIFQFNNLSNIPDGQGTFVLDYSIAKLLADWIIVRKPNVALGAEAYFNLNDYSANDSIPVNLRDQTNGVTVHFRVGDLKAKGHWTAQVHLAYIQKYAIVDYFAQNDWARWDYSSFGAKGSRLSNMKAVELRLGYAFSPLFNLIFRGFLTEQIVAEGAFTETGKRVRLDLNIGF